MRTPITMTKMTVIEDQDSKDGAKEGTKEYCGVKYKATGGKNENTNLLTKVAWY